MPELDVAVLPSSVFSEDRSGWRVTRPPMSWNPMLVGMMFCRPSFSAAESELLEHLVLHERQDVDEMLVLVVVGVDVDDQDVVEVAPMRLLAGVGEQAGGVQLLDRYAPAAIRR